MTLHLEKVPIDSARLPTWLERYLVGDHLGELIEELLAVRPQQTPLDFDNWFAPLRDQILSSGLSRVPRKALRQLLAFPPALRQLQAAVLLGGGRYWDEIPRSKGFHRRLATTRPIIPVPVTKARTPSPPRPAPRSLPRESEPIPLVAAPPEPQARRTLPVWAIIAAVIATVVISGVAVVTVLLLTNRGE